MNKRKAPDITVVIPIYNEEGILMSAVNDLLARLPEIGRPFEIILAENGSTDRTVEISQELAQRHHEVKALSAGSPNYGLALRRGIEQAEGTFVFCDEIDICDVDFHRRALAILESREADLVVGSKTMEGSADRRPLGRRAATFVLNRMLRVLLGFSGTDTHGLKAFRRSALLETARSCVVDRDLFASEFVIRAERGGVKVTEIPIVIMEKRPPSINLFKRVPAVLKGMARLVVAVRLGR
jgi:glycosyltransferase involved in cell wall biosynthesis